MITLENKRMKNDNGKVSLKKLEANRKNALRSTGPRTRKGKEAVKRNALKHGILAREIVIPGKEDAVEFSRLHAWLRKDKQPKGFLEEMLVENIVICYWRLRRVLRSEMGEIQKEQNVDEDSKKLDLLRNGGEEQEDSASAPVIISSCLPSREAADKLLRYGITIERQLHWAMSQLERLQKQRKGETDPPPDQIGRRK